MTRRAPLLALAGAFALGCAFPAHQGFRWAAAASLALAISPPLAPVAFVGAGALCAGARAHATPAAAPSPARDAETLLFGRVSSVPDRLDGLVRFLLREPSGRLLQV